MRDVGIAPSAAEKPGTIQLSMHQSDQRCSPDFFIGLRDMILLFGDAYSTVLILSAASSASMVLVP